MNIKLDLNSLAPNINFTADLGPVETVLQSEVDCTVELSVVDKTSNTMNRTKDELLLECIKHFEHIEDFLGFNRLSSTKSLINDIEQALRIHDVSVAKHSLPRPLEAWKAAREMELSGYIEWHLEQERRGNER